MTTEASRPELDVYEVVKRLVGPIHAIGETWADDKRLENLKTWTDLIDAMLIAVASVALQRDRPEHSVSRAGKFATEFLEQIGKWATEAAGDPK